MDISVTGIDRAIAALRRITTMGFKPAYDRYYQKHLRATLRQRYLHAAANTPYAPSSLGTRKRATGVRRGSANDPGFGIDSGALLREITGETVGTLRISDSILELMSVLPYSIFVQERFETKGPFAPGGVMDLTEDEISPLFDIAAEQIQQEWLK